MGDDAADYMAVARLQRGYADKSTRRAWSEFVDVATPDARFSFDLRTGDVMRFQGLDEFAEFAEGIIGGFSFYEYVPLNFVVRFGPDGTARGRSYCYEIGQDRVSGEVTTFYGWYHDDYARPDGRWLFTRRRYQSLARRTGAGALQSFPLRALEP